MTIFKISVMVSVTTRLTRSAYSKRSHMYESFYGTTEQKRLSVYL